MRSVCLWILGIVLAISMIMAPIVLCMNWDYRWKQACVQQGGVQLRPAETSSSRICVRGPVEIIPIAVPPFG